MGIRVKQVRKPDSINDQHDAADVAGALAGSADFAEFTNRFLSQVKRIIHGDDAGSWSDDVTSIGGENVSLKSLAAGAGLPAYTGVDGNVVTEVGSVGAFRALNDTDIVGGFRAVADSAARDAIPAGRRKEGMWVKTLNDGAVYELRGGIDNTDWLAPLFTTDELSGHIANGVGHEDDHVQYLLADGTRALSGNLSLGTGVTIDGRDLSVDGALLDTINSNYATQSYVGTAVSTHAALADPHTGYLLANGTRNLTGNLAVSNGITIDGRDISADGTLLDAINGNYATQSFVGSAIATHAALTSTHGVAGAIVGTSDTQTLSGKTFSDTIFSTRASGTTALDLQGGARIQLSNGGTDSTTLWSPGANTVQLGNASATFYLPPDIRSLASSSAADLFLLWSPSARQAPSGVQKLAHVTGAINQSGTAGWAGLYMDITETAAGSGTKSFLDFYGGASGTTQRFNVSSTGNLSMGSVITSLTGVTLLASTLAYGSEQSWIQQANQTFDQGVWAVGAGVGRQVVFCDSAGYTQDFDHAAQSNPTLYGHSVTEPNTANNEWWSWTHDTLNAIAATGKGNFELMPFSEIVNVTGRVDAYSYIATGVSRVFKGEDAVGDVAVPTTVYMGGNAAYDATSQINATTWVMPGIATCGVNIVNYAVMGAWNIIFYMRRADNQGTLESHTLTAGTHFNAETSNAVTAQNIADAINAITTPVNGPFAIVIGNNVRLVPNDNTINTQVWVSSGQSAGWTYVQGVRTLNIGLGMSGTVAGNCTINVGLNGDVLNFGANFSSIRMSSSALVRFGDSGASDFNIVQLTGATDTLALRHVSTNKTVWSAAGMAQRPTAVTLGAAATTFAASSNVMAITGNGGGNTVDTITLATPAVSTAYTDGHELTLVFVDANVTITSVAYGSRAVNEIYLGGGAFTSEAGKTLTLVRDTTGWVEKTRSH